MINPPRPNEIKTWDYNDNAVTLIKGQEMGAFLLGSTVINLFQANQVKLADNLDVDTVTRVGEVLAHKK